ncbi:unnamed protein product [Danaus chrysippus]|uniref:(African queen) hypothetical protein n=1 Tax=Danaus chrysippus TaxID=151541 RepID=A0A8J2QDZ5_9NEOP|nr:unnamed protein product [Danaus chrysippus]
MQRGGRVLNSCKPLFGAILDPGLSVTLMQSKYVNQSKSSNSHGYKVDDYKMNWMSLMNEILKRFFQLVGAR